VTLEPWNYTAGVNQPQYKLSNITAGNFDAYFRKFAQDSKAWGKPFYFRFAHEMNGNWYPWAESVNGNKSGDYAKAWKHVVDIFRAEGATNAKFVWCPNVNYQGSTPLSGLFPGDNYVDYVCMDGYNWGDTNGGFQSFTNLFSSTYNNITTISSKDVIIGEMASAEQGGSKSNWITDAYTKAIDAFPKIKLITWFNQNKEKDWRIESSTTSQNAFKAAVNGGRY
jgi:beta-mannanase